MAWHRLEHKKTGEVQIVASLGGIDLRQWDSVPIKANRAPGEFQLVEPDGSMRTDQAARERAQRRQRHAATDVADLAERVEAIEAALRAAGLMPSSGSLQE